MKVSIIVPAYRQGKTIKKDLESIHEAMGKTRWDFELILVDDGSPDDTYKQAKKVRKDNVKVFKCEENRGKGWAVKYGMARADGDLIAFIDSGMDINPNNISIVLEHMEWYGSDIIVGSKRHSASKVNYSLLRRIYSEGYFRLVQILFGLKVRDTQTGLKIFKRNVLEKVMPRLLVKAFAFDIELLAVANHLGFTKIHEAPVDIVLKFRKNSKLSKWRPLFLEPNIRGMFNDTLAVFYRLKILKYYDDGNKRKWVYNKELEMRVNTGE
ncbi:glycosyltransferase [Patescibacteria group bacterium]